MTESTTPPTETIELEGDTFISIEYARRWPKYVASWSARVQRDETSYPLAADTIETMARKDSDLDTVWVDLRDRAVCAARAAIEARVPARPTRKPGLWSRLFGNR